MDHPADPGEATGLEQVPGTECIDLHRGGVVGRHRTVDAAEMHDHLDPLQRRGERAEVAQVGRVELDRRIGGRGQIEHPRPVGREGVHNMAPEASGSAGNRDMQLHPLLADGRAHSISMCQSALNSFQVRNRLKSGGRTSRPPGPMAGSPPRFETVSCVPEGQLVSSGRYGNQPAR